MSDRIVRFLDGEGRIKIWPSKINMKNEVLTYLADKFESGRIYSEKEVNRTINAWHTFNDYFLLRRGLIDAKLLSRTINGSSYWKEERRE